MKIFFIQMEFSSRFPRQKFFVFMKNFVQIIFINVE